LTESYGELGRIMNNTQTLDATSRIKGNRLKQR
jgi:hypothetical protein